MLYPTGLEVSFFGLSLPIFSYFVCEKRKSWHEGAGLSVLLLPTVAIT